MLTSTYHNILVLGASLNPNRYSNAVIKILAHNSYSIVAIGMGNGTIGNVEIERQIPKNIKIHTITIYLNPSIQKEYIEDIIQLKPNRIIFNPGSENYSIMNMFSAAGIECIEACTMVMLKTGQF